MSRTGSIEAKRPPDYQTHAEAQQKLLNDALDSGVSGAGFVDQMTLILTTTVLVNMTFCVALLPLALGAASPPASPSA